MKEPETSHTLHQTSESEPHRICPKSESSSLLNKEISNLDPKGLDNPVFVPDKGTKADIDDAGHSGSKGDKPEENAENNLRLLSEGDAKASPVPDSPQQEAVTPHVYWRRWLMLALFCAYSFSNAFQWIHLNIIANVIGKFYNESLPQSDYQRNTAIDWLSMVYMLAYIPLIFPATWLLDKRGLRLCCIVGAALNAAGAWLKCASISPDRFGLLMFAQTVCAVAQLFVLGIPARLAAVWFGPNEVSTATSIGVFGNQVGVAVGFLLPPILVPNSDELDILSRDFQVMFYGGAAVTTVLLILIVLCMFHRPKP